MTNGAEINRQKSCNEDKTAVLVTDTADEIDHTSQERCGRFARRMLDPTIHAIFLTAVAAVVLRLTVRDRLPLLSIVYYALPPVVLAGAYFLTAVLYWKRRRRRQVAVSSLACLACLFWWHQTSYFQKASPPPQAAFKVLFWNAARGIGSWSGVMQEIRNHDAPLVGLVEARGAEPRDEQFWENHFPLHNVAVFKRGMVLLVKGEILKTKNVPLPCGGRYARADLRIDKRRLTVVIVDIVSNPLLSRKPQLEKLTAVLAEIEASTGGPVLVMGDFNTPRDSLFFTSMRRHFQHAFETAGDGFSETWPIPLPVLTLDHVWLNGGLRAHGCRLGWSWYSDHRPVVTDVSIVSPPSD